MILIITNNNVDYITELDSEKIIPVICEYSSNLLGNFREFNKKYNLKKLDSAYPHDKRCIYNIDNDEVLFIYPGVYHKVLHINTLIYYYYIKHQISILD